MIVTEEILELGKTNGYTRVEVYDLAHSCEVTHPNDAEKLLRSKLKAGRPDEPYGKRYHDLVAARKRLANIIKDLDPAHELQTINRLIGELEPKAKEAMASRAEAKKRESAAAREKETAK